MAVTLKILAKMHYFLSHGNLLNLNQVTTGGHAGAILGDCFSRRNDMTKDYLTVRECILTYPFGDRMKIVAAL
jgi:hypothetical protein